jgi:hypothetical protein
VKIEKGDPGVAMGHYSTVLFVMEMVERLGDLADPRNDNLGLQLEEDRLPQRIRSKRTKEESEYKVALVYVDLDGKPLLVGRLWGRLRKERESATFEYDPSWLENPARFSLEPALQLGPARFIRPATCQCSGLSGTQPRICGGGSICRDCVSGQAADGSGSAREAVS